MISASGPEYSRSTQKFLQRRVSLFGLAGGLLFMLFYFFRSAMVLLGGHPYFKLLHPSMNYHLLAGLSLLAVWALCGWGTCSPRFVRAVESAGIVATAAATTAMGSYILLAERPEFIVILALTFGLAVRSVYVPSSALRTFVLCHVVGIPVLAGTYIQYLSIDVQLWSTVVPQIANDSAQDIALSMTINAFAWWVCTVALCTTASRVIYGLRREVREARKLGQYTLQEKLGEGGMGEVYLAQHAMLRRPTAVKLLHPDRAGQQNLIRFEREVQLTAGLTHPNTVTIFDYGRTPDGVFYYVMELLEGSSLDELVEMDGAQPAARVVHILEQVAAALNEAHGVGLIHRDIKPANIILCERGGAADVAKVVDFGLVKDIRSDQDVKLTSPEVVTGTPMYMSPEAIRDPGLVDARADIYALGAVGYFLSTGTDVFNGSSMVEVCGHHLHSEPEPPGKRLGSPVPEDLERLLLSCLEKERDKRPANAADLRRAILACDLGAKWSEEQARAWWENHRAELVERRRQRRASVGGETVLDVDLKARQGRKVTPAS